MTKFTYNNIKKASISHISFKFNSSLYPRVSYKEDVSLRFKLKSGKKLSIKLIKLMTIYYKNFHYAQKLQKWAYNKVVKLKSYVFGNIHWLNNKYMKIKQNWQLKAKFFNLFRVLDLVKNQLKLSKKWKIHNVFYILLVMSYFTRKKQVDKTIF